MRKGNTKIFIIIIVTIMICSILLGTICSNIFFATQKWANTNSNSNSSSKKYYITFIQCGIFSKSENAEELYNKLGKIGAPFKVKDNNKIRVFFGCYIAETDLNKAQKLLKENNYDTNIIKYSFDLNDQASLETYEIVKGELQIINKLSDSNVKSVQTSSFKSWVKNLQNVNESKKSDQTLKEIKNHIYKLGTEITKADINENLNFIYLEIKKL